MNFEGSVVIVGVEGLEPPCDMPDLQSGAVAAVPYSQLNFISSAKSFSLWMTIRT